MGAVTLLLYDCPSHSHGDECLSQGCRQEACPLHRHADTWLHGRPAHRGVYTPATQLPAWWQLLVARCWGRWWGRFWAGGRQAAASRGASSFMERSRWSCGVGEVLRPPVTPGGGGASKLKPGAMGWPQSSPDFPKSMWVQFCIITKIIKRHRVSVHTH